MNILVTGGAGYVGSQTAKILQQKGHEIFIFDNLSRSDGTLAKWGTFIEGDICDAQRVANVLEQNQIEAVFHFAGAIDVAESMRDPMKYYRNNVIGTYNLVQAMLDHGVKNMIFSSSCTTYGAAKDTPIKETAHQLPINVYGDTKLAVEKFLKSISSTRKLNSIVLRYFNACGADLDLEAGELHDPETHIIPLALKAVFDPHYTLEIFGDDYPTPDGSCIRDYVHVQDIAEAHMLSLDYLLESAVKFDVFNIGSGQGLSVFEIIRSIEKITGGKVKYQMSPRRSGDAAELVGDITKIKNILKWQPQHSDIETIVRSARDWMLKSNPEFLQSLKAWSRQTH
ncbi:MAG: UDP-glucose 4-epimerase GalE [Bdellovibrionales bacterium]|nr:UDP-glucose 4-epimerase GalE [Bdellovibrionales bacterium]